MRGWTGLWLGSFPKKKFIEGETKKFPERWSRVRCLCIRIIEVRWLVRGQKERKFTNEWSTMTREISLLLGFIRISSRNRNDSEWSAFPYVCCVKHTNAVCGVNNLNHQLWREITRRFFHVREPLWRLTIILIDFKDPPSHLASPARHQTSNSRARMRWRINGSAAESTAVYMNASFQFHVGINCV